MGDLIAGLDIGTNNVRVVLADIDENNSLQIVGTGICPSAGLRKGAIVNIESTIKAIRVAAEKAEMQSINEIKSCIIGIGGEQVSSFDSRGAVAISTRDNNPREITISDVDEVLKVSRAVAITPEREIMHVVPQSYIIDGQIEVKDPIDMLAVRLEANVQVVTAAKTTRRNFINCVTRSGFEVEAIMYKMLAIAEAVMNREEKELGSILIDLGAGSTDVIVLNKGAPIFSYSLPVGGNIVTNDLSVVYGLSFDTAERIKIESGCCWETLIDLEKKVIFPGVGGRQPKEVSQYNICEVLEPRMAEIFEIIRDKIADKTQITGLSGNIILTGGGAAMPGVVELVSEVFNTQNVRIGIPGKLGGDELVYRNPEFATVIGLIVTRFTSRHVEKAEVKTSSRAEDKKSILSVIGDFFKEFF